MANDNVYLFYDSVLCFLIVLITKQTSIIIKRRVGKHTEAHLKNTDYNLSIHFHVSLLVS